MFPINKPAWSGCKPENKQVEQTHTMRKGRWDDAMYKGTCRYRFQVEPTTHATDSHARVITIFTFEDVRDINK